MRHLPRVLLASWFLLATGVDAAVIRLVEFESAITPLSAQRIIRAIDDAEELADEIVAAYKREGAAMTRRENVHRMADANKAFAHFAW